MLTILLTEKKLSGWFESMKSKAVLIGGRIDEKLGLWFLKRMSDTGKTKSQLLRDLIADRILFEENPWAAVGKIQLEKNARKTVVATTQGAITQ
jgi:hypothetical protein